MLSADNLQKARFTEVIRDVRISKANATEMREAKVNDNFEVPEVIRTGMDSRAELEAPDKTIARIGSNTVFSFEAAKRTMNLQSGSVLFHSPKGMGGGTIKTAAATAAVTGTTIMVGATSNGGFKLMVLEGSSRVTLPGGSNKLLKEGQMTFIMPGKTTMGPVINFDLQRAAQGGDLINGFDNKISSLEKINKAANSQQNEIKSGKAISTNRELGDADNRGSKLLPFNPQVDGQTLLPNSFPLLSSFLDSQSGVNLTLNSFNLTGNNVFLSTIPAKGVYKGFKIDAKGTYGAISGKNGSFSPLAYDFGRFGILEEFGIFASGTITFSSGAASFSNTGNALHFISTGGQIDFGYATTDLKFSASTVTFEASGDIINSSTGGSLLFGGTAGNLNRLVLDSRNGKIDLAYPIFNSAVTELRGDTINLTHLDMSKYTGSKVINASTRTGNWYFDGTGSLPNNSGSLNIFGDNAQSTQRNGGPGTKVTDGTTVFNINSNKIGP